MLFLVLAIESRVCMLSKFYHGATPPALVYYYISVLAIVDFSQGLVCKLNFVVDTYV